MRDNWLSNRVFDNADALLDHCCDTWNNLEAQPWTTMSSDSAIGLMGSGRTRTRTLGPQIKSQPLVDTLPYWVFAATARGVAERVAALNLMVARAPSWLTTSPSR
jgi:hypothetical protein